MKTLVLMRHASAASTRAGERDYDRILSARGDSEARQVAGILKTLNPLEFVISSAAPRALRTARLVAEEKQILESQLDARANLYLADADSLRESVLNLSVQFSCVLLVAHNPGISECIQSFGGPRIGLVPSAAVVLEFEVDEWSGLAYSRPKTSELIMPDEV